MNPSPGPAAQVVLAYHQASKHHLHRYAPGPGGLDWDNQPHPFRTYAGCTHLELPLAAAGLDTDYGELRVGRLPPAATPDRRRLAALFELGLGLAAWKEYRGRRWALRCNPSSGNLHPTEGYLLSPGQPGVPAGLWHYMSRDHVLERRALLPAAIAPPQGTLLGLTSIIWREAWKYGLRAFRYCQLDTGHALGALAYAAATLGWRVRLLEGVGEEDLAALLGCDRWQDFKDAEPEVPECLLALDGAGPPAVSHWRAALSAADWEGRANRLSAEHRDWPGLEEAVRATATPPTATHEPDSALLQGMPQARRTAAVPGPYLRAERLIRQRRSAQAYDGRTTMPAAAFFDLAARLLPDPALPPWSTWPWAARVHLVLFVHRVEGLTQGLYLLLRKDTDRADLQAAMRPEWLWQKQGPESLPLFLLLPHDLREIAALIACHQDIAADSCFSLSMLADFSGIADRPWEYRRRYWEAGLIGQVLYLEAEAAGLRGTGIGCYFDDEVHRLLGLTEAGRWQAVYHFAVGGALEDHRLTTLPPYPDHYRLRT